MKSCQVDIEEAGMFLNQIEEMLFWEYVFIFAEIRADK